MARVSVLERCDVTGGCGVLLGLPHDAAWCKVKQRLHIEGRGRTVSTSPDDPGLGGLMHLLWWNPSVSAVLVSDEAEVDHVRRAIELTGSDALLLIDASTPHRLRTVEQDTRSADLVVAALGCGAGRVPASFVSWSLRLAPAMALLDGLQPMSYDVLARLRPDPP